jgi:hypothetical protein
MGRIINDYRPMGREILENVNTIKTFTVKK